MRGLFMILLMASCTIGMKAFATHDRMIHAPTVPPLNGTRSPQPSKPVSNALIPPIVWTNTSTPHTSDPVGLFDFPTKFSQFDIFPSFDNPIQLQRRAHAHPHGHQVCASGCALSNHPTAKLSAQAFHELLSEFANGPISEDSKALEALLFYGSQTKRLVDADGTFPLDERRAAFLSRQLLQNHAVVSFRIIDRHNAIRATLRPTLVPLDIRHEFQVDGNRLQPMEASGTVKRVGLHHLWTRI